jgi:hypothetical protein
MKRLSIIFVVAVGFCFPSAVSYADEYVTSKSPDGKFALHVSRGDKQPFPQSDAIVDAKTRKVILDLDAGQVFDPEAKLVWSSDFQWAAYFRRTKEYEDDAATRVFIRNGESFDEIKMPQISPPKVPDNASPSDEQHSQIIPMRWTKTRLLDLEYQILSDSWGRTAEQISIQFDKEHHAFVVKSEPERVTILDYYLLLPKDTFETPARQWLHNATVVDKENGYMSVGGDGAQPSFEVALFRYRDGRPLLAVCEGELEGDDRVIINFYRLGADGRMEKASRRIFPIEDRWSGGADEPDLSRNWYFELPRRGRAVLVRSLKTKKVLHKVTWNGEKFVEEK